MLSPLLRRSTIPIQFSAPDRPTEWPPFSFEVERSLPQPRVDGSSSWFGKRGHTWGERNRCAHASEPLGLLAQPAHKCILFLMCRPGGFDALSD